MLQTYETVSSSGSDEIIIKKSRFIGQAHPAETDDDALRFISEVRKRYPAASHHCYAYVAGERNQYQKQSDDGEPSGTAGVPILEVINKQNLRNIVVVVTRFYGGINLGAGGLIRAYSASAVSGIEASKPVRMVLHQEIRLEIDYTWLSIVEHELRNNGTPRGETIYTDKLTLSCLPIYNEQESFISRMIDLTQGQGKIIKGEPQYMATAR